MNLVLLESSIKAKKVNEIFEKLGIYGDMKAGFTMGRIFDYSIDNDTADWKPRNLDCFQFLHSQIQNAESVIAMTDADEQGEYIAYQIKTIAEEYATNFAKVDLIELTERGIKKALSQPRQLHMDVVERTHTERLLNLKIAQYGIEKGIGATSIHKLMVANHLLHTPSIKIGRASCRERVCMFV